MSPGHPSHHPVLLLHMAITVLHRPYFLTPAALDASRDLPHPLCSLLYSWYLDQDYVVSSHQVFLHEWERFLDGSFGNKNNICNLLSPSLELAFGEQNQFIKKCKICFALRHHN
jgi:hypothetical protein